MRKSCRQPFAEAATVAEGHISARDGFAYQHNVRLYAGVFTGKQFARAAETCRYLVENKKYSAVIAFFCVARGDIADDKTAFLPLPCTTGSSITAASSSEFLRIRFLIGSKSAESHSSPKTAAGARGSEVTDGKRRTERAVHTCDRIAHRHCVPCIAVITGTDGGEVGLF